MIEFLVKSDIGIFISTPWFNDYIARPVILPIASLSNESKEKNALKVILTFINIHKLKKIYNTYYYYLRKNYGQKQAILIVNKF